MKNILQICKEAAALVATQQPENLFDASSQQEAVFLSIARDTLDSLLRYGDWPELTKEGSFKTVAGKMNYFIGEECHDFYSLLNNTVYIKDSREKIIGAITPEQWMKEKYFDVASLDIKFKLQNGMFKFLTPPPADMTIVFQYRSSGIVMDTDNEYAEKSVLDKNTDIPVFDEFLVKKGIVWRWYRRNGMPYEEEYDEYIREVRVKFGNSLSTQDISLARTIENLNPGVIVNAAKVY